MQPLSQTFVVLIERLRDALAAGDWDAIAVLDEECHLLVAELRNEDITDISVQQQLAKLAQLYGELQQSGHAERQRLSGELTRLNQSKQIKNAYKPSG